MTDQIRSMGQNFAQKLGDNKKTQIEPNKNLKSSFENGSIFANKKMHVQVMRGADGNENIYGADGKLLRTIDHKGNGEVIHTDFDKNGKSTGFKIFKDGEMVNEFKREE